MRVGVLGVGRAGGAIADTLVALADESRVDPVTEAVVVDTDDDDLAAASAVAAEHRHLVGQVETGGHGTAGDQEAAVAVARDAQAELRAALDALPVSRTDAFLVVAGLSGGTGGGLGPCLAELLAEVVEQPIYAVGVLPSDAEDEGGDHAARAMRALRAFREPAADVLLVDLDRWRGSDADVETAYDALDRDVAEALWALAAASETSGGAPTPERTLDTSEIINTLRGDGVATLARARNTLPTSDEDGGLVDSVRGLFGDSTPDVDEVAVTRLATTTTREAIHSKTFLGDGVADAGRAAVVVDAPGAYLLREGIEEATGIVEDATDSVAVRAGDRPRPRTDDLGVTVLAAGLTDVPRLDELERRTREYLGEAPDDHGDDLTVE
ncbi:hypothetical protein RYH80_09650 [Halobaculum sp. MBLA0147]|uniref:hypothetical protein n=1 Tax=Halobaculum sp. MBLA0147 TaxID=3079934 RepID=UPI0035239F71